MSSTLHFLFVCVCGRCGIVFISSYRSATLSLSQQAGPGTLSWALSGLLQSGKSRGGDAERCQHGAQKRSACSAPPPAAKFSERLRKRGNVTCGYHDQPSQGRGHLPPRPWALPACGSHHPAAADAAGNALPSPASRVHLRTPAERVMTKGIDTQMLRQKFSARAGNWYKWLQTSCEAERVLTMWHRDLRDSCGDLPPSLLLAAGTKALPPLQPSAHTTATQLHQPGRQECLCPSALAPQTLLWESQHAGMQHGPKSLSQLRCRNITSANSQFECLWQMDEHLSVIWCWARSRFISRARNSHFSQLKLQGRVCICDIFFQTRLCCSEVYHQKRWDFWRVFMG